MKTLLMILGGWTLVSFAAVGFPLARRAFRRVP